MAGTPGNPATRGGGRAKQYTVGAAKDIVLDKIGRGETVQSALEGVGRKSLKTWEYWRKSDPDFKARADQAMALRKRKAGDKDTEKSIGFEQFRERYLGRKTYRHQHQWIDVLEGREPRDLHPSQVYTPARKNRILVNTPPNHAKTTTITMDYITYRICMDPSVMVKVISKTERRAQEFVYGIKQRLTHPDYVELQKAYAPDGGWKASADSWTASQIYIGGDARSGTEKDPTVQALGLGGQLYGSRTNLIVLDDVVDTKNAHEWEKSLTWIQREVENRPGPDGKILVIGTRMAPTDLYSELLNPKNYYSGKSPWTYLTQPAVLEGDADGPEGWVTLWPESSEAGWGEDCECGSDACANGVERDGIRYWPRWDGLHLGMARESTSPRNWNLVYLQRGVDEDSTFLEQAVLGSVQGNRRPGPLHAGALGHPEDTRDCFIIGAADLGFGERGFTAFVVMAVNPKTRMRYILTAFTKRHPTPAWFKENLKQLTLDYNIQEWRIEKNAAQVYVTEDEEIKQWLATRGAILKPHYTGNNKHDLNLGVASIAPLFGSWRRDDEGKWYAATAPLIQLPSLYPGEGIKSLVEQLVSWWPGADPKRVEMDLVMALWFAEIRAREVCRGAESILGGRSHRSSSFLSPRDLRRQGVVNITDYQNAARSA